MTKLPDLPSELLTVALRDLEQCEAEKEYVIDMTNWHQPRDGKCVVCMAGAVMAKTLGANKRHAQVPADFSDDTCKKLTAIDNLRNGFIYDGLSNLDYNIDEILPPDWEYAIITDYDICPERFKTGIRDVIARLKECNL